MAAPWMSDTQAIQAVRKDFNLSTSRAGNGTNRAVAVAPLLLNDGTPAPAVGVGVVQHPVSGYLSKDPSGLVTLTNHGSAPTCDLSTPGQITLTIPSAASSGTEADSYVYAIWVTDTNAGDGGQQLVATGTINVAAIP